MDSASFRGLAQGLGDQEDECSGSNSRPTTKASRTSSTGTVIYAAKRLPKWARSFYSNGDTSVIGSSSRPTTGSKTSQSSLRNVEANSGGHHSMKHCGSITDRSPPSNTAPTESPASSQFHTAIISRPRNRPRGAANIENWTPSSNPSAWRSDDGGYDNPSVDIETHIPSTSQGSSDRDPRHKHHQHQQGLHDISCMVAATRRSRYGTQHRSPPSLMSWRNGSLRHPGPADSGTMPDPGHEQNSNGRDEPDNPNQLAADRQVLLFSLGFLVPFAWMLAAFLPVQPRQHGGEESDGEGKAAGEREQVETMPQQMDMFIEKERMRAIWWRWLNRRMSVAGAAVIVIVVVAVTVTVTAR